MKVIIDYKEISNCIEIKPMNFKFTQLRGLNSYIKIVNGKVLSPELVEIPLDDAAVIEVYSKVKRIFEEEFLCEIESNIAAQRVFNDAEEEARKFLEFSNKAKNIRNNEIIESEFADFCMVLGETSFKRSLKSYQLLAAYHLAFSQNACNFSVPGSGKTSTVLAAYEYLRKTNDEKKQVDKLVVVGPLSAFIAWKMEYKACFGYEPNTLEIRGGVNKKLIEKTILKSNSDLDLIIISYGSIQGNYELIEFYLKNNRCMMVLDEAHRIKKVSDDAQSNYVLSLAPFVKARVVLTGTPAANSYVDLFNLYKYIWPFNNVIGYSISQLAAMSKSDNDYRVDDLVDRINPFFIRVKKSNLGLPEAKFNSPDVIKMSTIQREIYEAIEEIVINKYESSGLPESIKRSAAIRLRQAASNPGLLLKSLEEDLMDYENDSKQEIEAEDIELDSQLISKIFLYKSMEVPNKFYRALELAREFIDKKERVIIWCEFIGTCDDLSEFLHNNGIKNRILYGKCCQEEREEIIREFLKEEEPSFNVIIANPHAVGESISLHTTCHNAIYLEQGFNAGVYMQSKDRIHRVGLKENVVTRYFFIHSAETVDNVVYERVLQKEMRMLELIESQEIPLLSNIDYEENSDADIKAIIKDYYERRKHTV